MFKSDIRDGHISVVMTRAFRVGKTLRINPSEAWLGIESGVITIIAIDTMLDMVSNDAATVDGIRQMEAEYQVMVENLDTKNYPDDAELERRLEEDPWVMYQYASSGNV